jgi:alpha-L-fucosidase 2
LALYRWLLTAMIECAEKNNSTQPEIGQWKNSLNTLIPLPTNENGVMIGSEQGLDKSHRHYSHLLGLYPLFVLNPDNDNDRKLVDKSVVHWHQIGGGKELAGYSYTGAASLYAALGRGNDAEAIMRHFLNGNIGISLLLSNTFYVEAGGKNPVIETPLSAANAISEMLLQSWGGKIRIFPAMPDKWQEASFDKLRTQGAFLVSAVRKNGQTQWVKIKSLAGEPCIVKIPGWTNAFQKSKGRKISITALQNNEFTLDLKISEEIILLPESNSKIDPVTPITLPADKYNFYGVKKGKELKWDQNWQLPEYTL